MRLMDICLINIQNINININKYNRLLKQQTIIFSTLNKYRFVRLSKQAIQNNQLKNKKPKQYQQQMFSQTNESDHYSGYSRRLNDKINMSIDRILQLQDSHQSKMRKFVEQLVTAQDIEDWIVIESLFSSMAVKTRPKLQKKLLSILQDLQFSQNQTYIMRVYIYGLIKTSGIRFTYGRTLRQLKLFVQQGKLLMFNSWLVQTVQTKQSIQTVSMLCKYYPLVVSTEKMVVEQLEVEFVVHVITHLELRESEQFENIQRLLSILKTFRIPLTSYSKKAHQNPANSPKRIDSEEHLIIKITLDILATSKSSTGNAMWLFNKEGMIKQSHINSFINIHGEYLLNYSQDQLARIFSTLFSYCLQPTTLLLFEQLSYLLRSAQNYYTLKTLYKLIVLPIIIYRGKAKLNLQPKVLAIASFYIIGFYQHCDIGINGLTCILMNINKLQSKQIQQKWIQLAFLLAQKNMDQYCQIVYQSLINQNFNDKQIQQIDRSKGFDHFLPHQIWEITVRNARKLKHYPLTISTHYKGIQNHHLQCYIISVMQALFTTKALDKILAELRSSRFDSFSYHLKDLFRSLKSTDSKYPITVNQVKDNGPQQFSIDDQQQDAQQYLSKVLQKIQQELIKSKEHLLLQQFYKAFRFKISRKLQCQSCRYIIDKSQEQFIHTLTNKISLREKQVEEIDDYQCEKCKKKMFLNRITLQPTSKILIVHINRFSFTFGKSCKELATQPIKRSFMGYRLKGMVFHIGKIVECGHYVYYFNQGGKKWVEMNDHIVNQFQTQTDDEEFEREMRVQMTPYILFYVRE